MSVLLAVVLPSMVFDFTSPNRSCGLGWYARPQALDASTAIHATPTAAGATAAAATHLAVAATAFALAPTAAVSTSQAVAPLYSATATSAARADPAFATKATTRPRSRVRHDGAIYTHGDPLPWWAHATSALADRRTTEHSEGRVG